VSGAVDLEPLVIDLITRDAVRVPPYPAAAMRLQKLVSGGEYGVSDLARVAGEDPALAATLLRCANSAHYRGVNQVSSIQEAIARIGASEVCRIALAISVGTHVTNTGALAELRGRTWRQSLMSALICQQLGERRKLKADEAFICGLLHDFGRLVAIACFEQLMAAQQDDRVLPEQDWEASVDRFHVELGLVTAVRWNLSPLIAAVISSHHRPELGGIYRAMVDVVTVSDSVIALLENKPRVTSADLVAVPAVTPDEMTLIINLIPQLPSFVATMDEVSARVETAAPSQVTKPPTLLEGTSKRAAFDVSLIRSSGNVPCTGTYMTPIGLAFEGPTKIRENNLVRLKIEGAGLSLEIWANVLLCQGEGNGFRIEAKAFGLDRATQTSWDRFYASLPD
jgi:HD-like signal output (HDOD) protein